MSIRQLAKLETRQRVIDAAAGLFDERGFAATTVRDIAQAGGVSVGTVMAVGDKEALLILVFDALLEQAPQDRLDAPPAGSSCAERSLWLVRPFVDLFALRIGLARSYASILVSGKHASRVFTDLADRLITEFVAIFTAHACLEPAPARARARALYSGYVGTLLIAAADPDLEPAGLAGSLRSTFASICNCGGAA